MGENGAGKSTLMKILSGAYQADPGGEILVAGKPLKASGPIEARAAGVSIIYQELALVAEPDRRREHLSQPRTEEGGSDRPRSDERGLQGGAAAHRRDLHAANASSACFPSPNGRWSRSPARCTPIRRSSSWTSRRPRSRPASPTSCSPSSVSFVPTASPSSTSRTAWPRSTSCRTGFRSCGTASYVGTITRAEMTPEVVVRMMVGRDLSVLLQEEPPLQAERRSGAGSAWHRRRTPRPRRLLRPSCRRGAGARRPGRRGPNRDGPDAVRGGSADRPAKSSSPASRFTIRLAPGCDRPRPRLSDRGSQGRGRAARHVRQGQHQPDDLFARTPRPACSISAR